jgi:hypothetical protein
MGLGSRVAAWLRRARALLGNGSAPASVKVKGMVQVMGQTYRVARTGSGEYQVTRILDDRVLGSFMLREGAIQVLAHDGHADAVKDAARAAVGALVEDARGSRSSWRPS